MDRIKKLVVVPVEIEKSIYQKSPAKKTIDKKKTDKKQAKLVNVKPKKWTRL